ncbi:hypothetical protein GOV12_05930 [Candidatus Pacearchaeota archaeon]|nr:hypothetical protein [Candidatus Pacearchaeota archaeon]
MAAKDKLIGFLLIIIGAFPLLMMIEGIKTALSKYEFLMYVIPEEVAIIYQVAIIVLGLFLVWTVRSRIERR